MRVVETIDFETRDRLVMEHVGLVKQLAQRMAQRLPPQVDVNDLISVGTLGLIDAAGRYQATLGVPFDAFARRRIQGAMLDALRELDWAPRSARRLRRNVDSAVARLRHELGREPEDTEIARALNLSPEEFDKSLDQLRALEIGSLRQLDTSGPDGTPLLELCVDPSDGVLTQIEQAELREHLAQAIQQLPDRERHILALYYEQELTLAEIGQVIGVCESRVSQLRTLAISRLRTTLREILHQEAA